MIRRKHQEKFYVKQIRLCKMKKRLTSFKKTQVFKPFDMNKKN